MGQLPDEKLQKGGSVVLLELVPWKHAVVEGGLELLAQRLGWMQSHTQGSSLQRSFVSNHPK